MGKADVFLCSEDIQKLFAKYMGNKPILFDPLLKTERIFRQKNPQLSPKESKRLLEEKSGKDIQKIHDALSSGRNVAFLEYGDPTIYGSWIYWRKEFQDVIEIVPGISAFNAGNAAIAKHIGCLAYCPHCASDAEIQRSYVQSGRLRMETPLPSLSA